MILGMSHAYDMIKVQGDLRFGSTPLKKEKGYFSWLFCLSVSVIIIPCLKHSINIFLTE